MKILLAKTILTFVFSFSFLLVEVGNLKAETLSIASTNDTIKKSLPKNAVVKKSRSERNWNMIMNNPLFLGLEFSNPQLQYGYKAKSPWFGPSFMALSGLFHANFQRGTAEVADSGTIYKSNGWSSQFGFRIPLYSVNSESFNFIPNLGFGFSVMGLEDRRKSIRDNDLTDPNLVAFHLSPGLILRTGPLVLTINYTANIGYNFSEANAFKFFNHYPNVGIYMTTMPILMNPTQFTAMGKKHYKDLVSTERSNSGLYVNRKVGEDQNSITYRREQIQWIKSNYADRYEEERVTCRDVRPFTYIGPRLVSTWFTDKQMEQAINLGINAGFRYGMWWVNAFAESGSVFVKSPADAFSLQRTFNTASVPNLSGQFKNSMKFGGQIGIELLARAMKSDFKPHSYQQAKEIKSVTSYVGIIPYVGYGISQFGTYSYNSANGAADLAEYTIRSKDSDVFDPSSIGGNQAFFNFGACFHFGAAVIGMDYNYYPNAKKLNGRQIHMGLNLPIARMLRSLAVKSYIRKIKKAE